MLMVKYYISYRETLALIEQLRAAGREADAQKLEKALETGPGDEIARVLSEVVR